MTRTDLLETLGSASALALSIFVLCALALRIYETPAPKMHLWAMVGFFAINALDALDTLAFDAAFSGPPALSEWQNLLIPGFVVALYFFVRGLTSANAAVRLGDWVHLLPFVAGFACLAPLLLLPGAQRMGIDPAELAPGRERLVVLGENAFWALWIVLLVIYIGLSARRLIRHKRNIRAVFSDLEGKTLRWLDALVVTMLVAAVIVIVDEARRLIGVPGIRDGAVAMLFDIGLAMAFGLFALRAVPPLPKWSEDVLAEPAPDKAPKAREADQRPYARSGLQESDLARLAERLEWRMAEGKLWRDPALNLRALASEVGVPSIHLSEVLNTKMGMSFYDYVNQCRVRDACEMLIATNLNVLEISETVGFNAKSTFNASFKKVTDQTPTQWRQKHKP